MSSWLVIALAALGIFWAIGAYNRLVGLRNAIASAFAQIDEQLRRRQALLQALLGALPPALSDEHGALDALGAALQQVQAAADSARPRACSARAVASLGVAEKVLASALARALALLEQHGELREHDEVIAGIAQLRDVDLQLGFARQLFNDASRQYNRAVRQFPTRLLTGLFGFRRAGQL